jgi:hypothetical protein
MDEQARAARDMTLATTSISKEVGLITRSNRQHLTSSEQVLGTLTDIRQITERNSEGVKATLSGTNSLIERARQLNTIVDGLDAEQSGENGAPAASAKPRSNGKPRRSKKGVAAEEPAEPDAEVRTDEGQ